ncbi:ABC transporter ATP-binding protein [Notoacmeibacter sp. MSK16QG-6]|uniref:ABC transporter ATP-binding protein n=1 Tax=Notoacmeibacter sp. MSK16QG-6 TaxID=2957982 RepID=UPI0020A0F6E2|nr:ABC transporter ATP-binding protein [Notoacmeibacter sp. MSK16QG-6]MCP1199527.1 ABC transporter ATP-binding protein [Notoacmeibacter sp. MSK16QG-6]
MSALLTVDGLTKRFGGLTAVDGMSFEVSEGETVALLGPNGSGKTTVLNMISGALDPSAGSIFFDGERIDGDRPHDIANIGISRTFQLVRILPSLSLRENVVAALAFGRADLWGGEAEREADRLLGLVGLRSGVRAADLTYLDQKRLEMARALAGRPRLLLLDEWLSGLNPTEMREGIALVRRIVDGGTTVLLVEHIMDAVRALCSRSVVMKAGTLLAEGPTADVLADAAVIEAYLGDVHA